MIKERRKKTTKTFEFLDTHDNDDYDEKNDISFIYQTKSIHVEHI